MVKIWKWLKLLNSVLFIKKTLGNDVYIRIWSSWLTFTVLKWLKTNFKICQFSRVLLRYENAILVKIWKWLKLFNSVPFIKKTLVNQVYIRIWSFEWFSQLYSEWRQASKLVNLEISAKVRECNSSRNLKMTKTLKSVPFIKKTLGNDVYIRIWSTWLTFTVLEWTKTNFKISQSLDFC